MAYSKTQWNVYLGQGKLLLSDMGCVLMSLVEHGAEAHDTVSGTSDAETNVAKYGDRTNGGPAKRLLPLSARRS